MKGTDVNPGKRKYIKKYVLIDTNYFFLSFCFLGLFYVSLKTSILLLNFYTHIYHVSNDEIKKHTYCI